MNAKKSLIFAIPGILAGALLVAVGMPSVRERIQEHFANPGREILATAEGDLLNDSSSVKVVKFRDADGIHVEILKGDGVEGVLIDRILLPDKRDGLFNYQGHVTRLAIADIDNDGKVELLAPTFDNQLVPHLNVFRYNPTTKRLEPYQPIK